MSFTRTRRLRSVSAAISMGDRFMIEAPGVVPISVCLERNAESYKGALVLRERKKPLRHLVGISEGLASGTAAANRKTILASSISEFVWTSLAHVHGLPGMPEWAEWFCRKLEIHQALIPLLGVGCNSVLIKGRKEQFLSWLEEGG